MLFNPAQSPSLWAAIILTGVVQSIGAQTPPSAGTDPGAGRGLINPDRVPAGSTVIETKWIGAARRATNQISPPLVIEEGPARKMAVGEVTTIGLQQVARIAIGNGALVKATVVDDRQIVLLAEAPGETTMHVWLKSGRQLTYRLTINAVRVARVLEDLQEFLRETPGITARLVGERVVMEGRYPDTQTATRLKGLASSFPQVLNLVPDRPADADPLQLDRMVQIDLRVIEVKRRALDQLGIKWAGSTTGPTFATNVLGYANTPWRPPEAAGFPPVNTSNSAMTYLGLAAKITSALTFLEQNGDAWTLAEPRLSCRSGGESAFLAGGEIPIPVAQGFGAITVEYKKYGVRIDFKPVADGRGNIDSTLMVEVSEPDTRNSNNGFVAFTTNRTETQVALKDGEPLVIAGLMRQRAERATDGVPGLSRIPVISYLFKSRENTSEQTELFVIATPRVITPDSAVNKAAMDKANSMAADASDRAGSRLAPTSATGDVDRDK